MNKDFNISMLMDFYGELLTDKQLNALDYYYNQDLSLQEIADNMDISRQGVRDFIKRGEKQLIDLERCLKLAEKFSLLNSLADKILNEIAGIENEKALSEYKDKIESIKNTLLKMKENL